ncbi:hypothetical protein MRX96_034875 [Rhipicephalus microplus]
MVASRRTESSGAFEEPKIQLLNLARAGESVQRVCTWKSAKRTCVSSCLAFNAFLGYSVGLLVHLSSDTGRRRPGRTLSFAHHQPDPFTL